MNEIFVSYATPDREWVEVLVRELESEGLSVWWDRELLAGAQFEQVIDDALKTSPCVIVLWSKAALASQWVKAEADRARKRNVLVPIRIQGAVPPLPFDRIQTLDVDGWDGDASAKVFQELVHAIGDTMSAKHAQSPTGPGGATAGLEKLIARTKRLKQALAGVAVIAVAACLLAFAMGRGVGREAGFDDGHAEGYDLGEARGLIVGRDNGREQGTQERWKGGWKSRGDFSLRLDVNLATFMDTPFLVTDLSKVPITETSVEAAMKLADVIYMNEAATDFYQEVDRTSSVSMFDLITDRTNERADENERKRYSQLLGRDVLEVVQNRPESFAFTPKVLKHSSLLAMTQLCLKRLEGQKYAVWLSRIESEKVFPTDRLKSWASLNHEYLEYTTDFTAMGVPIFVVDDDLSSVIYMNEAARGFYGSHTGEPTVEDLIKYRARGRGDAAEQYTAFLKGEIEEFAKETITEYRFEPKVTLGGLGKRLQISQLYVKKTPDQRFAVMTMDISGESVFGEENLRTWLESQNAE